MDNFIDFGHALGRSEMKKLMAGSGGTTCEACVECWSHLYGTTYECCYGTYSCEKGSAYVRCDNGPIQSCG